MVAGRVKWAARSIHATQQVVDKLLVPHRQPRIWCINKMVQKKRVPSPDQDSWHSIPNLPKVADKILCYKGYSVFYLLQEVLQSATVDLWMSTWPEGPEGPSKDLWHHRTLKPLLPNGASKVWTRLTIAPVATPGFAEAVTFLRWEDWRCKAVCSQIV